MLQKRALQRFNNDSENMDYGIFLGKYYPIITNQIKTIDKLDKYTFDELHDEFISKGLTEEKINELKLFLKHNEPLNEQTKNNYQKLKELLPQTLIN